MKQLQPVRWDESTVATSQGTFTAGQAAEEGQESVVQVALNAVGLLRRNWPWVLLIVAVALGIAAVIIQRDGPQYRANAVLRYSDKSQRMSAGLGSDMAGIGGPATDPLLTQIQLLQSRAVAAEVVDREGLRAELISGEPSPGSVTVTAVAATVPTGELALAFSRDGFRASVGAVGATGNYGDTVNVGGVSVVAMRHPGTEVATYQLIPRDVAIDRVQDNLRGRPRERTDIIDITYVANDPYTAQRVVNTAGLAFQDVNAQMERQESVRRRRFIEERLRQSELQLSEAQLAHNAFRSREGVYSAQQRFQSQQADLGALELRRRELASDRSMYASLLAAIQAPRGEGGGDRLTALVSSPGVAANPVVAQLYSQLVGYQSARDSMTTGQYASSTNDPDVRRLDALIASTESKIVAAVRGQINAVDARLAVLNDMRAQSAGTMSTLPASEATEGALLASVESFKREADRLREELGRAQIAEAAEAGQIDIVDLAPLPRLPIGRGRLSKLILALILGLALGGLVAYVRENYRPVIRVRDDLTRATSLPNLALVPRLRIQEGQRLRALQSGNATGNGAAVPQVLGTELVTVGDTHSSGAEAYRTLRTNLMFSAALDGLKRVVVTSSGPQEGKSTTAANVSVAFALQGLKVLLVDCDLRRPRQHKIFGESQAPGLTNALLAPGTFEAAFRTTPVPGLTLLAAGTIPPNPSELVGSPQMLQLLDELDAQFDLVILDTPPLLAAADAAMLARSSDGAVVVVRSGQTERGPLQEALQQLTGVGARILGTVLNDPDAQVAKFASHYDQYYSYSNDKTEPAGV